MFLTRMSLNPARRGTRYLVASPQRMHAAVMSAFPPASDRLGADTDGRVLWRIDAGNDHTFTLYVSSLDRPDLTHLVEQAGWPTRGEGWSTADSKPFLDRLEAHQRWVFRVTANPVWAQSRGPGLASRRKAHVTAEQQERWFLERTERNGFVVPSNSHGAHELIVRHRESIRFPRHTDGDAQTVTLVRATFEGVLRVSDPDLLRSALRQGIGRAKGYGCGLLTLAPAP